MILSVCSDKMKNKKETQHKPLHEKFVNVVDSNDVTKFVELIKEDVRNDKKFLLVVFEKKVAQYCRLSLESQIPFFRNQRTVLLTLAKLCLCWTLLH